MLRVGRLLQLRQEGHRFLLVADAEDAAVVLITHIHFAILFLHGGSGQVVGKRTFTCAGGSGDQNDVLAFGQHAAFAAYFDEVAEDADDFGG